MFTDWDFIFDAMEYHCCRKNEPAHNTPDSKIYGANMGPTWVLSAPGGTHVDPMNLAIRDRNQ